MKQEEASVEVLQSQEVVQEAFLKTDQALKKSLIVSKNEQEIVLV